MTRIDWPTEVRRRQDALLRDLSSLLAIPSVKDETSAASGMPLGAQSAKALRCMMEFASREGLKTAVIEGIVGYAEYGERNDGTDGDSGGYIAILCHVDVVPASGEWSTPPFEAAIRNGRLYARGALDDKGPAIAAFYGLRIVKELGLPLRHKVRLIVGTDEETGMKCMDAYNRHEPPPLAGFTPDADFPIVHAEKGQINTRMTLRFAAEEQEGNSKRLSLSDLRSGTAANMVPDLAEATLHGPRDLLEALAGDFRAYCWKTGLSGECLFDGARSDQGAALRLEGLSSHGMAPETGINAGLRLLEFLDGQPLSGNDRLFVRVTAELLAKDTAGEALGIACRDDTMGPLTVNAGLIRYNPGAREAYVHLNIRFPACTSGERIVRALEKKLSPCGFRITPPEHKPPHVVPASHPMIRTLRTIYEEQTGEEAALLSTGGGTYACKLPNCVAFGPLFPGEPDTAHQPDESIALDSLFAAAALYARAIYELANIDYGEEER